ncbi:MAG TPA: asparagine--tRNA ligase [Candidatus Rifleibacterium sp.]|nr:asparagine--tRNA ligase [Candidatus Rifleibacterium sp.]HPT47813.1 asparagine--tRNA ligase [Candidatus Rifleibacterium sp.]
MSLSISKILKMSPSDQVVSVSGWVRTRRSSKNVSFVALNDGSTILNLQLVVDTDKGFEGINEELITSITTGASLVASGKLVASQGSGQAVELLCEKITVQGLADPETFPLQPKKHSLEFLREIGHLRFRTNVFGAILRVRHAMTFAIHKFFNDRGFFNIHSPIITGSDCEGAGEMFRVTTLPEKDPPLTDDGKVDYTKDFFGKATNLTVSGQLEAELAAMALSKVYTFGPTFRAENSNTTRHLAEFWMIEPEVAFNDLTDNMNLAEEFLKYLIGYALENCADDMEFLSKRYAEEDKLKPQAERETMTLLEKLEFVRNNSFERITYTEAIEILKNCQPNKKKKFQYPVENWGIDLQSEHERYLVEKHFKKPVIVTDYPRKNKAFYMRVNPDGNTVAAMDILVPGVGEIIGGSQREERFEILKERAAEFKIPEESIWWYLDIRRFGSVVHSGFGLGFERLLMFVTGMGNVRDVSPFPRTPKTAEF